MPKDFAAMDPECELARVLLRKIIEDCQAANDKLPSHCAVKVFEQVEQYCHSKRLAWIVTEECSCLLRATIEGMR